MSVRPIPPTSALTQPYWDAARRGEMVVQRCESCGDRPFPPRATCPSCGASSLSWSPVSGRATVYSYTIAHRPPHPAFAAQHPPVVAVGMAVEAARKPIDDTDMVLPVFTPTNRAG